MISIEDCVELAIRDLEVHVRGSEERLIQAARGDKIDYLAAASVLKRSMKEKRLEDWEEKIVHGQYLGETKGVRSDQCWAWLQNGDLKRETEVLIVAAQNRSMRTNLQLVTKYLRLTLVFMENSAPWEKFDCYFSGLFC